MGISSLLCLNSESMLEPTIGGLGSLGLGVECLERTLTNLIYREKREQRFEILTE